MEDCLPIFSSVPIHLGFVDPVKYKGTKALRKKTKVLKEKEKAQWQERGRWCHPFKVGETKANA